MVATSLRFRTFSGTLGVYQRLWYQSSYPILQGGPHLSGATRSGGPAMGRSYLSHLSSPPGELDAVSGDGKTLQGSRHKGGRYAFVECLQSPVGSVSQAIRHHG